MNANIDAENVTSGYHIAWNEPEALPYEFLPNKLTLIDTYEDDTDSDAHVVPGLVTDMETDLSPMLELDGLRYLRLPVRIPLLEVLDEDIVPIVPLTDVPKSNVKSFLDRSGKDLVSLELCAVQSELLEFDETKQGLEINRDYMTALLDGLVFPNLKHLSLQNWVLPGHDRLENFFSRHRSTLKEVNLLQCLVSKDQDPTDFGRWAGQNLSLVGVSIDIHPEAKMEDLVKRNDNDLEPWDDSDGEDTDWRRHDGNLQEQTGYRTASAAPGEPYSWTKTELEALWLSGRPNCLKVAAVKPYPFKAPRKSPFDTLADWSE
ncbi:hypothetical protein M409DRAFT_22824 [Zasmidium cellare ATCC 36951]|uniref:Uncharacterized protein n=1 Tax=Zasmidium cellare ATCC 36951 TaxID=1080233 RepID=A0A6A6CKS8_ZASCE|nr:uncharacterized protein M409DRAFT_22824 [Zasmidium cellare ATCC 36951]KAF2166770.1 hypothetical protein M409DRAFT_22824 [Zasmidium cellare ATCC 36951]